MNVHRFVEAVREDKIPKSVPVLSLAEWNRVEWYSLKRECNIRGMWAMVSKHMARDLAVKMGRKLGPGPFKCLEVMAGRGWLAKALRDCGVNVIATDNQSWFNTHSKLPPLVEVKRMGGLQAVRKFGDQCDLLIMSWPPMSPSAGVIAKAWGSERPILYIGEGTWGCTGAQNFWEHFTFGKPLEVEGFGSWPSVHDDIYWGYYKP